MRRYGWIPDHPDQRDHVCKVSRLASESLPKSVDPRAGQPPIQNQGELGSCTGHGMAGSLECGNLRNGERLVLLSRLMAYYNARRLEGTTDYDAGATIRGVVKAAAKWGCCTESLWPYDVERFKDRPPRACYSDAKSSLALKYERVPQNLNSIKTVLAAGFDVVFGFTVYGSFEGDEVAKTGILPMPATDESALGGHCVRAIGYTDEVLPDVPANHFIVANSWGTKWGLKGYFAMPYGYLTSEDLASDLWTIRRVA